MRIYLNKHKYSNTETEDLWAALEQSSGEPVAQIMGTWTKQMGFPVVKASVGVSVLVHEWRYDFKAGLVYVEQATRVHTCDCTCCCR